MQRTRDEELDAAALALAEATERYKRAEAEALRIRPPEGIPDRDGWSRWMIENFRLGPRERVVAFSGAQFESFVESGMGGVSAVTPFGTLRIIPESE